jgi:hypothetical protein
MSNMMFPLAALALMIVGTLLLLVRHREPRGMEHGIQSFQREMRALSPEVRKGRLDRPSSIGATGVGRVVPVAAEASSETGSDAPTNED